MDGEFYEPYEETAMINPKSLSIANQSMSKLETK